MAQTRKGGKYTQNDFDFPMETAKGVYEFFMLYPEILAAAHDRGDMNALALVLDFEEALQHIKLSDRQKQSVYYVFMKGLSQRQAGEELGVTQQAVQASLLITTTKIADFYKIRNRQVGGFDNGTRSKKT